MLNVLLCTLAHGTKDTGVFFLAKVSKANGSLLLLAFSSNVSLFGSVRERKEKDSIALHQIEHNTNTMYISILYTHYK